MKPLHVKFDRITAENIGQLRKINAASLPVSYSESFYQDILKRNTSDNNNLNHFAYHQGKLVGAICARLDSKEPPRRVYILTLAVLAAYRGRGIGSQLLECLLSHCAAATITQSSLSVDEVYLHVQISNTDAIRFYTERFGFAKGKMIENYYKRIKPPHCYLIYKDIRAASCASDKENSSRILLANDKTTKDEPTGERST